MSDNQTTRPLTDEQWMYWQKLVGDEHDRQAAEIERLRGHILRLVDPDGGEDDDIRAARAAVGV
jgi:hypothetical protein